MPQTPVISPVELPSFGSDVPYVIQQAFARLRDHGGALAHALAAIPREPTLTLEQIRKALGATGASPLNIFTLLGGGSSTGVVQMGTHATRIGLNASNLPSGLVFWETDRTAAYLVISSQWWLIGNLSLSATLSPNTKPSDLTARDAGFLIRSTDFDREYRWSGTAWADAPGSPARGQIAFFPITIHADFTPGTGWQLCNGTAGVTRSTPTGTTTTFTAPDLTTDSRFLRSVSGATGGTGGAATTHTHSVDPPSTASGTPSATVAVQSGAGTTVATDSHTHNTDIASFTSGGPSGTGGDDALPPYYNARPYIRL